MDDDQDSPFCNGPLSAFPLKGRILIRLATTTISWSIRILGALARYEVHGAAQLDAIMAAGKRPIYVHWHDDIVLGVYYFRGRGLVCMISLSFDGEYIARTIRRFGFGAIRGSSSRKGKEALTQMADVMREGYPTAFAADGPRGPRHVAKIGPVILARRTGNPIVPFVVRPEKFWTLRSWDRLTVPRPFTRARMVIGAPIYVPADADEAEVERAFGALQQALDSLVARGNAWPLAQ